MKKSISLVLLAFLIVTFSMATAQTVEELGGACLQGNIDAVKKLIKAGVDVTKKFNFGATRGATPLLFACMFNVGKSADRIEIIKILIDAGANVNEKRKGMTLLHFAVQYAGDKAIIELLLANGLDINSKNNSGETPLYGAAFHSKIEWVEALIKNGADLNAGDRRSHSPLHLAALKHYIEVAELLIANGANVNAKTKGGETPLDLVRYVDHKDMADLIRKHGGIHAKGNRWK